jgi:hypothetical protein
MTSIQRPMTKKERTFLERERLVRARPSGFEDFVIAILSTALLAGIGSGIWLLVARITGLLPRRMNWSEVSTVYWGVVVISLLATVYWMGGTLFYDRGRSAVVKEHQNAMEADAASDIVTEERVTIASIKVFREPEHFMKIYFLLFGDNRILVRYDYDSANMDGDEKSKRSNFPLHQNLTMVRFPQSGLLKCDFSGPVIRKPRALPLNVHPDKWPEDETYCTIPWDDLVSVLSA